MKLRRKPKPAELPDRPPDLIVDGRELWIAKPTPVIYNGNATYNEGRPLFVLDGTPRERR